MQPRKQFMDNFRNKKGKSSSNSFDGMLGRPNGMPQRNAGGFRPTPGKQPSQPLVRNTLDNFRATDGFHAAQQPLMRNSEAPALGRNPRRTAEGVIDLTLPPAAAKPHKRRSWKKITMRSLAGVMVLVLLVGGFLFGKGYLKLHQIFRGGAEGAAALQDNVDPSRLRGEGDGRVNILMLGIGGQGHDGPDLSDTIIIASIDPVQKQAALLSIPRDLWVKPSGYGYMKINAVYANNKYSALSRKMSEKDAIEYGLNAVDKEIQADIGIPIHYHALIDARGFEQAINTVGGVDINVDAANTVHEVLWDDIANKQYVLDVQQGMQHFDGQRATFYARSRHTSTRGDFDRSERQRLIMIALKSKILSLGTFSNPAKISSLIDAFGNHIQANMTLNEITRLYSLGKDINNITSVGLADPPNNYVVTDNVNGTSIVRPRAGLTDFSEIQNYIRNALKDGFIANENASVAVLNGTGTPGLATKKATELKSYGYNVNLVGDAPTKNYSQTILVDLSNGQKKYTRHYLEQRLGVTAVTTLPDSKISNPGKADFVIILGQNAVSTPSQ